MSLVLVVFAVLYGVVALSLELAGARGWLPGSRYTVVLYVHDAEAYLEDFLRRLVAWCRRRGGWRVVVWDCGSGDASRRIAVCFAAGGLLSVIAGENFVPEAGGQEQVWYLRAYDPEEAWTDLRKLTRMPKIE